jgi:hypothetical protein
MKPPFLNLGESLNLLQITPKPGLVHGRLGRRLQRRAGSLREQAGVFG